jgi:DNA repair protein RecN (Recombination protein N)
MLLELVVENYAVVERLRVRFHAGLNLLTGETGSGKSIVVDALGLLFGGRASAEMVRTGADKARISGIFELPDVKAARIVLEAAGLEIEDNEILIEREILANGKSRAFAASRPVTAALLRDLAPLLGDIHGQHDQQRLFVPEAQLEMLDTFGNPGESLTQVAGLYTQWRKCSQDLEQIERAEKDRLRLADLWAYQRKEIETVNPKKGEDAELEAERRILQNGSKLEEAANAAYSALYDSATSALAGIRIARKRVEEICRIDPTLEPLLASLQPAEAGVEDAAFELRSYLGKLEADPARLDQVESRLDALDRVKRKYGPELEQVIAFLEDICRQMEVVENAEEHRQKIRKEQERLAKLYREAAARLSEKRAAAAQKLQKRVEEELASLAMERTRFRIDLRPTEWSARGADVVQFLVAANAGEEPRPMDKVASGGELSRIALALKTCLAATTIAPKGAARTLVFDEVDTGIGGRAAETVGRRLKQLAAASQVLCVTHLAQIASFADHHYSVEKREAQGRTYATVEELAPDARTREISRMLSGHQTPEALRHAEQLIELSKAAN